MSIERNLFGVRCCWLLAMVLVPPFGWSKATAQESAVPIPKVVDDGMKLELFACEPDIVTPVGATFDNKGRLLVIESHTHQRPEDYVGPEADRIRIVQDTDGDGKADRFTTFFQGTTHTMSIRSGPDGWIYVATRAEIFRIRDTDGDDLADERQPLIRLETRGNYPHNGLSGLALDADNSLYFGMGENLGVPYRMVASDDTAQRGSGEGGVFRCDLDGKKLERIATGFWNPFGICVDPLGRIFAVGNDADGRPPSRLVQIVETGDYGFQYRYGRSGIHPLQAWDGELPGTLPMVTGTGEAPCELVVHDGSLITGAWGDFRVERYHLVPTGASFQARREVVVQGDENFRPVAFAEAPDGSLFFTDWVDKSYPVHGKGRIWRLSWKDGPPQRPAQTLSVIEQQAMAALETVDPEALSSDDRFLRQHAVAGLAGSDNSKNDLSAISLTEFKNPNRRLSHLQALRWTSDHSRDVSLPPPINRIREGLADVDPAVRLYSVRWVADAGLKELRAEIVGQLESFSNTTPALFNATVAALEFLDTGKTTFDPENILKYYLKTLGDEMQPAGIRAMALRMIPVDQVGATLQVEMLAQLIDGDDRVLQREAVRALALAKIDGASTVLSKAAMDQRLDKETRKDAIWAIESIAPGVVPEKPAVEDLDQWMDLVSKGGDANEGWRQFYDKWRGQVNCASCHTVHGRGGRTGPDLTGIAKRTSRRDVLESILFPSRNIAPRYVGTVMTTANGKSLSGLFLGHSSDGKQELFQDSKGNTFSVDPNEIEQRRVSGTSIMPEDIHTAMTAAEIRDLLAFLEQE